MSCEEKDSGFEWTCDQCSVVADFPAYDFWRALSELKARGWHISRGSEHGEWFHYCAKCGRKRVNELLDRPSGRFA